MTILSDRLRPLLALPLALGLAACGDSSAPAEPRAEFPDFGAGPSGAPEWRETWQGNPAVASNPAALPPDVLPCMNSADPSCDVHTLVVPDGVRQVMVAIKPDQDSLTDEDMISTNDYDLYLYDDSNTLISYYADADGDESLVFETNGSAFYEVRVAQYLVAPGNTYSGVAAAVTGKPIDRVYDCNEFVPQHAGLASVTDAGERVELSVELLLDGTDPVRAAQVMAKAAESYAPLGIDLVLAGMRPVTIHSLDSGEIIQEGKAHSNGVPPAGVDVVTVFTNKEMQAYDPTGQVGTVIGQADCIGGIRYPERSFAVVTDVTAIESDELAAGFSWNMDAAAETLAHEVGHLMGAHHHYGNCVEGNLTSAGANDVSPCTLMFPAVNGASLNFGALEGLVVRGHAVEHAGP